MATLLKTDWTKETVTPANGINFTLKEMQTLVGGWIELVPGCSRLQQEGKLMLVDEEGLIKNLPYNAQASVEANRRIVGRALVLTLLEFNGPPEQPDDPPTHDLGGESG